MRCLLLCVLLSVSTLSAQADPDDLEGGVLIMHAPPLQAYCYGLGWCELYDQEELNLDIESCSDQINQMPLAAASDPTVIYVIAAWTEEKRWCGTEFGISPDFNDLWYFSSYGPCLINNLENSTSGWPGAGQGTAVVATDTPWEGNFRPVYYFEGYGYEESLVALDVDPAMDFAGTGNCDVPAGTWSAVCMGAIGVGDGAEGIYCCPTPPSVGACCFDDGSCEMLLEDACAAIGGLFLGEGIPCEPDNPCVVPTEKHTWGEIKTLYR